MSSATPAALPQPHLDHMPVGLSSRLSAILLLMLVATRSDHLLTAWGWLAESPSSGRPFAGALRVGTTSLFSGRIVAGFAYSYDANGNVTSITPPGRPAHSFTYTAVDLEQSYLPPQPQPPVPSPQTLYSYNADRQVTGITRPDGQQITLSYAGGKLTNQTFPTGAVSYGYNPQGNLSAASFSGGGTVNYTYDGSLLTSSTWSGPVTGNVTWTYDNNYRKTSQSVNGGNTINFSYDNDDLLTSAGSMTLTRDAQNGLLTGTTLGTTTDSMTYNSLGEVATATSSISGSAVLTESYTRDSLGRISTKTETIQGTTTTYGYTYDTAGRLTEVKHNGNTIATYAYDSNGNRLSKTAPGGTVTGSYDDQDRLLTLDFGPGTLDNVSYTYTANGELASKSSAQSPNPNAYSYDALGNLRSVTLSSGTAISYVIDGEHRRIGKTVNGTLVQGFLYENQLEPVAELDGAGTLVSRFVYCGCGAGNIPQYLIKGGVTYRIVSDHLGSPRLVIDVTSGAIVQRMDYDEFGTVILDTNPGFQPFGFAGGIYDRDTGLVRHGARDYDPETGRWAAKDPIGFKGGDANLYGYVLADPINAIDPSGLEDDNLEQLCEELRQAIQKLSESLAKARLVKKPSPKLWTAMKVSYAQLKKAKAEYKAAGCDDTPPKSPANAPVPPPVPDEEEVELPLAAMQGLAKVGIAILILHFSLASLARW